MSNPADQWQRVLEERAAQCGDLARWAELCRYGRVEGLLRLAQEEILGMVRGPGEFGRPIDPAETAETVLR